MPLIVIASENRAIRRDLHQILVADQYEVIEAEGGNECLTLVKQHSPDVVLVDDDAVPLKGDKLCAQLRNAYPQLPILTLLNDSTEAIEAAFEAGTTDIISHPVQPLVLRNRLARVLESYQYISMQAREMWYHSVIDNAIEGIYRSSVDGQFLFVNAAMVRLLGYETYEEVLVLNIGRDVYVRMEDRQQVIEHLKKNDTYDFQGEWKRKDGQHINVHVFVRGMYDGEKLIYLEGEVLDITEQKRAETALQQSRRELQVKTESLETINRIADEVYHSLDLDTVLNGALQAVMNYLKVPGASIYLVETEDEKLIRMATRGVSAKLSSVASVLLIKTSLNGQAVLRKDIVISDNPADDERVQSSVQKAVAAENVNQIIAVPLMYQEQVIGTLSMPLNERRRLTLQQRATLLSVGKTIGLAVANAQYVQQIEAQSQERLRAEQAEHEQRVLADALRETAALLNSALNQDEVLQRILTNVRRVVPSDMANIYLIHEDGIAYSVRSIGYAERQTGLEGEALHINVNDTPNLLWMKTTGQPRAIPDTLKNPDWIHLPGSAWIRSAVSAPIQNDGKVIGFINLDSSVADTFDENDATILKIFADQAGIAIRNAQLYDAIRKHADTLEQHVEARASELFIERAKLRAILDGMADGVIGVIYDEPITLQNYMKNQPSYRYINQSLFHMLGYSDKDWSDARQLGQQVIANNFEGSWTDFTATLLEKGSWQTETRFTRADGTQFDVSVRASSVKRSDGETVGYITIVRDISREKKLEQERTRFISNAAHELRTPLTNLKTRLYLARKQPERMATHLQILEQVTDHMRDLAEYLLDLSRLERGSLQLRRDDLDMERLVNDIIKVQQPEAEKSGVTLTMEKPRKPLTIKGDAGRLNQVMTNLVSNAIRHTPRGGSIVVRVVPGQGEEADCAVLEVCDTGVGIPTQHLPYIFEPFYQATQNATGVGLGLSISKEIVELHGGQISVTSKPGEGTCFRVKLPLA